jgi:hypothetical protein
MAPEAALALMAGIEYLCSDLLSVAGNFVTNQDRRAIELADLRAVVRANAERRALATRTDHRCVCCCVNARIYVCVCACASLSVSLVLSVCV